jgi:hypothetical protein
MKLVKDPPTEFNIERLPKDLQEQFRKLYKVVSSGFRGDEVY